jgi:hypothetical protein
MNKFDDWVLHQTPLALSAKQIFSKLSTSLYGSKDFRERDVNFI